MQILKVHPQATKNWIKDKVTKPKPIKLINKYLQYTWYESYTKGRVVGGGGQGVLYRTTTAWTLKIGITVVITRVS